MNTNTNLTTNPSVETTENKFEVTIIDVSSFPNDNDSKETIQKYINALKEGLVDLKDLRKKFEKSIHLLSKLIFYSADDKGKFLFGEFQETLENLEQDLASIESVISSYNKKLDELNLKMDIDEFIRK